MDKIRKEKVADPSGKATDRAGGAQQVDMQSLDECGSRHTHDPDMW